MIALLLTFLSLGIENEQERRFESMNKLYVDSVTVDTTYIQLKSQF